MSHHLGRFENYNYPDNDPGNDRIRMFVRRNRKKIWAVLIVIGILIAAVLIFVGYIALGLLKQTPQAISGSVNLISQNSPGISNLLDVIMDVMRQWGFLFN